MNTNIEIGSRVVKLGTDYTAGRAGTVIEINAEGRLRVGWETYAAAGQPHGTRILKTWVKPAGVRVA